MQLIKKKRRICPYSGDIRLVTYNVWFDRYELNSRTREQISIFQKEKPHVICLQEVTQECAKIFGADSFMRENYIFSDNPEGVKTFRNYGVMLLVHRSLEHSFSGFKQLRLPSTMYRDAIVTDLRLQHGGKSFKMNFVTVHLESLNNAVFRRVQLLLISEHLQKSYENALVCGDFNFGDSNWSPNTHPIENEFFEDDASKDWKNYIDCWKLLHEDEAGFTFDTDKNPMIHHVTRQNSFGRPFLRKEKMRYDRIFMKSDMFDAKSIRRLGTAPFKKNTFPSDHFGLFCTLTRKTENA